MKNEDLKMQMNLINQTDPGACRPEIVILTPPGSGFSNFDHSLVNSPGNSQRTIIILINYSII
jgi:hypothetical protein